MSCSTRTSRRATWTTWTTCYAANGWTTQFPKGVLDIVSAKDAAGTTHYYSVPLDIHRANVLWYNKTVFTANNLTAPTTWDQFFTVADALKAKGITPLAVGDNGIWANGMLLESILIGSPGRRWYNGLWTGLDRLVRARRSRPR
jgi:glucose/mannose transport system substrate-binding protein